MDVDPRSDSAAVERSFDGSANARWRVRLGRAVCRQPGSRVIGWSAVSILDGKRRDGTPTSVRRGHPGARIPVPSADRRRSHARAFLLRARRALALKRERATTSAESLDLAYRNARCSGCRPRPAIGSASTDGFCELAVGCLDHEAPRAETSRLYGIHCGLGRTIPAARRRASIQTALRATRRRVEPFAPSRVVATSSPAGHLTATVLAP